MLALPTFWNVVGNTLSISIAKIILRLLVPLILALLLNEVVHHKFMRMAQTVFFLPYFLSWAVMGGVLRNLSWAATPGSPSLLFSPTSGKIWAIT